jgi:hypothetical protein
MFSNIILKAITDYKLFLRRILPARECSAKIVSLGIKRTLLRKTSDVQLYDVALKISKDLAAHIEINKNKKDDVCYSGALEFLRYLNRVMGEYIIDNGKVVHTAQSAACAVVDAFQIISLADHNYTIDIIEKLVNNIRTIAKYGDKTQISLFMDVLKSHEKRIAEAFRRNGRIFKLEDYFVAESAGK